MNCFCRAKPKKKIDFISHDDQTFLIVVCHKKKRVQAIKKSHEKCEKCGKNNKKMY